MLKKVLPIAFYTILIFSCMFLHFYWIEEGISGYFYFLLASTFIVGFFTGLLFTYVDKLATIHLDTYAEAGEIFNRKRPNKLKYSLYTGGIFVVFALLLYRILHDPENLEEGGIRHIPDMSDIDVKYMSTPRQGKFERAIRLLTQGGIAWKIVGAIILLSLLYVIIKSIIDSEKRI